MIYGYCRISTDKQNIERQIRNIQKAYRDAVIKQEIYTGTKTDGRKMFEYLLKIVCAGDTIVFDSVSRMSRNAETGFQIYQELYDKGVELVFLKEPHINTATYKKALSNNIEMTGTKTDIILKAINEYLMELAKEQIIIAFEQSQIGRKPGAVVPTKKSVKAKQDILKYSKDFGGTLTDVDCMRMIGIARNTYYRYKAQLKNGA